MFKKLIFTAAALIACLCALAAFSGAGGDVCAEYLSSLGYEFENDAEVKEITIPTEFDDVYNTYNELQKEAGYDLLPYAGEKCEVYTYELLNHPFGECRANIIVRRGRIIGGDISSVNIDGFMESLG